MPYRVIGNDNMPAAPVIKEVPSDFEGQARNAFANLANVLAAAELTLADVVKTTVYLTDAAHFEVLNALFGEYFPNDPPTRATPIVRLPNGLMISIEAIAANREVRFPPTADIGVHPRLV